MSKLARTLEPEVMDTVEEAVDYDSMDHSAVNQLFVEDLLQFCSTTDITKASLLRALDLGTGTALIPLQLLKVQPDFGTIIACDLSAEMLKIAREHVTAQQLDNDILPTFCDAKQLPVASDSCHLVMSNSIVHHIPEPADVFGEMRRTMIPGGLLFVRDLMRPETDDDVEHIVRTYAGDENTHQQQLFRQSLHAALTVDEVRILLSDAGFDPGCVQATSDRHWTIAGQG